MPPSSDAATSSGPVPPGAAVSQGKPSLRRIKGRVHRSKSLDSIDLLDCNVSREITNSTDDDDDVWRTVPMMMMMMMWGVR